VSVSDCLVDLGGVATRGTLVRLTSRAAFDRAVAAGEVVRLGRGRYGVPGVDEGVALAATLGGAVSHTSAALHHGWAVLRLPDKPHVTVSRGRKLDPRAASRAPVHIAELGRGCVRDHVTDPWTTLAACLRSEPFDAALAVADSALRAGFGTSNLVRMAEAARGPGARGFKRVAAEASPLAANPFESGLRAIAREVPGLDVRPQVDLWDGRFLARPDLVDERLRIVIEADSFAWHGGRDQLAADARRFNSLVGRGWVVLRFSWEDVMFHPDAVREVLREAVALAEALSKRGACRPPAA
jgi:very-short-patch-repair endonuclease